MSIHGFELVKKQQIKEINSEAYLYKHIKTGSELLSVVNDDENKVFGITFRTPPEDSTGVAHILEHSVLCGSRKYPVKEPFVELLKSSLQTFLNAMTFPDKTCYPVASQNTKDLYNLIDVYLDAVFYPDISGLIFQQEGWHYDIKNADDPLSIKGVVYNEMKGVYSSPDNILVRYSQQSLFPDSVYGLESGGDPQDIPSLTYEQFTNFHKKYYHPSNSRIYFYGDDDPESRLKFLDSYLKDFNKINPESPIGLQRKISEPVRMIIPFPAEEQDKNKAKGMITVNWMLNEVTETAENFAAQILSYILLGMPASPLRKALIESGLGEGLAGIGLESDIRQMYFSVGLKGIDLNNADAVEDFINETFSEIAKKGIDPMTVEAAFNSIEFALRENNTGSAPRGLALMLRALTTWLYDSDPMSLLSHCGILQDLKEKYSSNSNYFENMIKQYFIENRHRSTVILVPDNEIDEKNRKKEAEQLEELKKKMTQTEIERLIENNKKLQEFHDTPDSEESLASIPVLSLSEIDKLNKKLPVEKEDSKDSIYYHDLFTNEILYFDLGFDLDVLPQKYLPYVSLFGKALLEMGTEDEDYAVFSQRIRRKTGGIRKSSFTSMVFDASEDISGEFVSWMFFRGKVLMHGFQDMFDIFRDMFLKVRFDNKERFKQIVLEMKSAYEQGIIPSGNRVVNSRIRSHLNSADWIDEKINGISMLFFLRELVEKIEYDWNSVLSDLQDMRRLLVNRNNIIVNSTVDSRNWNKCRESVQNFINTLPANNNGKAERDFESGREFEGLLIPSQVNYVGKGVNLYNSGYKYHGSINVITRFLRTGYLWDQIRVQGGAYGALCQFSRMSGALTFVSYRDPNLLRSLDVYDKTAVYLKNIKLSENELQKNIIGTIGEIDSYMLPDAKGYTSLLWQLNRYTDEIKQEMRDQVLNTGINDFYEFAGYVDYLRTKGIVKVLGEKNTISSAFGEGNQPELTRLL
ncbi:MAG: insulinase family protein [Spirochaetes bacterium]|nr:insulinase family protein [Spirochaetota bacterium]